ncbi:MAG: glycosyltransferase family 2 protein [Pirellulaceae bacterium]
MPRLSVIVPHQGDDQRLETTLVSLLEHRPDDCEILVVHDGTYSNPYALDDEIVFVETEAGLSTPQLLNEALMAACSPTIHFLVDGIRVTEGWEAQAVQCMERNSEVAAVAIPVHSKNRVRYSFDLRALKDTSRLQKGAVSLTQDRDSRIGCQLSCGLFRKEVLLALGGLKHTSLAAAEYDLSASLKAMQYDLLCDYESAVESDHANFDADATPADLGRAAVEHGYMQSGLMATISQSLPLLLTRPAVGMQWLSSVRVAKFGSQKQRIAEAERRLAEKAEQRDAEQRGDHFYRRAA